MRPLKKWQEPVYALGSLGPGILNQMVLGWVLFYYRPSEAEVSRTGALVLISASAASAVWIVARILDGVCDIPIASWTDNFRSRWGRRRPMMVIGLIPMAAAFLLLWNPPARAGHWLNALWMAVCSSAFFFFYTFVVVPYLAVLSEIASDEHSRLRIASWQAAFSTLGMAVAVVLAPLLIGRFGYQRTAWMLILPSMLCYLGPLLVIKEPFTAASGASKATSERVSLWYSVRQTLSNRRFAVYMATTATVFVGLQLFVTGQPYIVTAVMGLDKSRSSVLNIAAFALMPVALPILNLVSRRRGTKQAYRAALLSFAIILALYPLTWDRLDLPIPPLALGAILAGLASYSLAAIMAIPNAIPAQIAYQETQTTGEHRAGMFFAVQGVINQMLAALAGGFLIQLVSLLGSSTTQPYGALVITPIAALLALASWIIFARYPDDSQPAE